MKKVKKIKRKIILEVAYKWCYNCNRWKGLDHFCKNKSRYDNKSNECKECAIKRGKLRYVVDPKIELPFCECGCGERVSRLGNKFINHHNIGDKNHPSLGRHNSEKTIQKMSVSAKNRLPVTEETKQKISKANKGKFCGENHWNWQGGTSCEPYCIIWTNKEFKQAIRDRDNNIAWDIGYWYKGGLSLHHIDYDKKNCAFNNIITVSKGMNTTANYHKKFCIEWFQTAMNHRLGYEYGT